MAIGTGAKAEWDCRTKSKQATQAAHAAFTHKTALRVNGHKTRNKLLLREVLGNFITETSI